jgi:hypothetical protein
VAAAGNAAAGAPIPVEIPPIVTCHKGVLYDMFILKFLTKHVRAAAIVKSVQIEGGYRRTITVPGMKLKIIFVIHLFHSFLNIVTGDRFVAIFYAHNNQVSGKKGNMPPYLLTT